MLDYDREAEHYDDSRGGQPRAEAAAAAVRSLLPADRSLTVVDVAGGTGIVAATLGSRLVRVVVADLSEGMLRQAARRMPGLQVRTSAFSLPVRDSSIDAITCVWLLHLLASRREVAEVIGEAARVLRPGGKFVTTVDKDAAVAFVRETGPVDRAEDVVVLAERHRLVPVGEASFPGPGRDGGPDAVYRLLAFARQRS